MENNNAIQIFKNEEFGEVRTVCENNDVWFVGKDVATILGYKKPENAISSHVDGEDKTSTLIQGSGSKYKSKTVLINESGLYSLVLSSKLPSAKKFKHWVTSEVLPSIRKTGGYKLPQTFSEALRALADAEEEKERLALKIKQDEPKVQFAEAVDSSPTAIKIGDLAKILRQNGIEMGRNRLFTWLRENGYLMKNTVNGFSNMPTQMAMELKLFEVKEHHYDRGDDTIIGSTTLVTVKGQKYFINLFLKQAA